MYASLNNSIYREQPFTQAGTELLTYKTTLHGSLPDLQPSYISLTEITASYLLTEGERILLFSPTEFPNGAEEIVGVVVDNLNGTWTAQLTSVYTEIPTSAYDYPLNLDSYPQITSQEEIDANRLIFQDQVLTYVSGTDVEFVGTNMRGGMLEVGDTIEVTYNDTVDDITESVTITSVTETGAGPTTYTCGFDALPYDVEPDDGTIPNRSHTNTVDDAVRSGDPTLPGYTIYYDEQLNPMNSVTWMIVQRQITSPINWTITEPMVLDYSTKANI